MQREATCKRDSARGMCRAETKLNPEGEEKRKVGEERRKEAGREVCRCCYGKGGRTREVVKPVGREGRMPEYDNENKGRQL